MDPIAPNATRDSDRFYYMDVLHELAAKHMQHMEVFKNVSLLNNQIYSIVIISIYYN